MFLRELINAIGIENVKILMPIETHWLYNKEPILCTLEKYWEDDDFSDHIYKIKVVHNTEEGKRSYSYYMDDLEHSLKNDVECVLNFKETNLNEYIHLEILKFLNEYTERVLNDSLAEKLVDKAVMLDTKYENMRELINALIKHLE